MPKLLISILFMLAPIQLQANELFTALQKVETEWADIYYSKSEKHKSDRYRKLIDEARELGKRFPAHAEPLIWQANLIATHAELENGFNALSSIRLARDLLLKAISIDPSAMEGAAYVTLGSLYHMVPSWPIAFGSDRKAKESFLTALKINPKGIDTNYFYAEYLLSRGEHEKAAEYFKKALDAPVRKEQIFADSKLKEEARLGLENTEMRKISGLRGMFVSLFSSASATTY